MDTPTPEPVVVTNFPEQSFDWVSFSSLVTSVIALAVALWSVWWSRKTWWLDGPKLAASARFGLRDNTAIGIGAGYHYSLQVAASNRGRTPIQCHISALEFYGAENPNKILYIDPIGETLSIESGHFWNESYDRSSTIATLRQLKTEISHVCLLILTAHELKRFELDRTDIDYLNKIIKIK
ncbi:hypothetical protein [Corynebacterium minutissimum]|uniref:hypothetical protein n=1 Tax=Corynebacterium minutissimum TaxID=38301 RepID=UPI001EF17088|nr:hypothetical protein [Corynebacterium minutissimum]MCG7229270.1 hypothetical protein [Corynebacterium minutissimum]MCG7238260.1 hypothetical protein [Corynebacterium minutissimum]